MLSSTETEIFPVQGTSDEVTSTLHRKAAEKCQIVLETLYDSYNGYKQCADGCKDSTTKLLLQTIAANRAEYITQLSNVIEVDFGMEP